MNDDAPFPPASDEPPMVLPARRRPPEPYPYRQPPPPPPRSGGGFGRFLLALLLLGSMGLNLLLVFLLLFVRGDSDSSSSEGPPVYERHYAGPSSADDKIAVVRVEGVLMEGLMGYAHKQVEKAAKDAHVKAVVLRIDSPGGTVTASDELHHRLTELRDGNSPRYNNKNAAKPIVASMGSVAASGGYYIAMPARPIFAERTTITGSIGVYASLLDVHELANQHGVHMHLVKAGDIKASGSMMHELTPAERQPWQDMVDAGYKQFISVVEEGRPLLKGKLTTPFATKDEKGNPVTTAKWYDDKGVVIADKPPVPFARKLADGGIYTAQDAKAYGLVDGIGTLDDVVKEAAKSASLTDGHYKVVVYERPTSLLSLFGGGAKQQPTTPDLARAATAVGPRAWYLAPNCELAGYLAAIGKE